jgi:hypothetical protein
VVEPGDPVARREVLDAGADSLDAARALRAHGGGQPHPGSDMERAAMSMQLTPATVTPPAPRPGPGPGQAARPAVSVPAAVLGHADLPHRGAPFGGHTGRRGYRTARGRSRSSGTRGGRRAARTVRGWARGLRRSRRRSWTESAGRSGANQSRHAQGQVRRSARGPACLPNAWAVGAGPGPDTRGPAVQWPARRRRAYSGLV